MTYTIFLRDKNQIQITEEDYNNISNFLGQLKLFRLADGQIVNAVDISRISPAPSQQVISKEFRLEKPKEKEERIKTLGGWQKPSIREKMKRLFTALKEKGHFKEFKDYFEWEEKTYKAEVKVGR